LACGSVEIAVVAGFLVGRVCPALGLGEAP
jgi:hypothetical protein